MTPKKRALTGLLALSTAATLALAGCSSDNGGDSGDNGSNDSLGTVKFGFLSSWTDGLSLAYLTADQLEKLGYEIEMEDLTDAGIIYTGLAEGDIDLFPSGWPEVTHAEYMEKYGDDIEDLGTYYEGAVLTIAVPDLPYMDEFQSIDDLVGEADRFGGQIVGIEPGAGLTNQTENVMMPEYGLDEEYTLTTSSTATMLATLEDAIDSEEPVVVTLWRPFWANSAFPVRDLEDPKGAMGTPEGLHELGKAGFSDEFPEAAELISKIKLSDEAFGSLESLVTSEEFDGDPEGAVDKWIDENPDAFEGLLTE